MKVGVVGTGPVGLGCAALLDANGHEPLLWSPRRRLDAPGGRLPVVTEGLFAHRCDVPVATDVADLAAPDAIIVCVLGNGHRAVFEALAPVVRAGQTVIISSHCSMGALYLSRLLAARGLDVPIVAWATTLTGGPMRDGRVQVRLLRKELDVAAIPQGAGDHALSLSRQLFTARFQPAESLLAIALSNLNPPIHMASAILNFTRIEKGEVWDNFGCITPGVGRLIEGLDAERLAIAAAFGLRVRSAREHYLKSFPDLVPGSVAEMAQQVSIQRQGSSPGPARIDTRYMTEDVPFGIVPLIALARAAGIPVPLHEAGLAVANAIYGRDFASENDLLPVVGLGHMDAAAIRRAVQEGWPRS